MIMKKVWYILLSASMALLFSCAKEVRVNEPAEEAPRLGGETLTFTARIELAPQTRAGLGEASETGMPVLWSSDDSIGIATNNSAVIKAYPITVDATDATQCTFTVEAVPGATAYYALFKGSLNGTEASQKISTGNFEGISFDTETKTFSGLTVGDTQVGDGALSSYLWHDKGYPLAMAGKANGTSLVMKPCLALVKLQIHADSVPADQYVVSETYKGNAHSYSAIRGFDFYQRAASSLYSSGDYTVRISDDNQLTVAASGNNTAVREKSLSTKLVADTPYYMCVIPGGEVSSFRINFLGFADNAGTLSWDAVYTMNLVKDMTVAPGSFFDLGTLNPLGRKMAKNHAEDDAAASAAVTIDGQFGDWTAVTNVYTPSNDNIVQWKYTYDDTNLYFLYKIPKTAIPFSSSYNWGAYIYMGFNTDNLAGTGSNAGGGINGGYEAMAVLFPWRGTEEGNPSCVVGEDGNGHFECPVGTNPGHHPMLGGAFDGDYCFMEVRIPRTEIGSPTGNITVNHSLDWSPVGDQQIYIGGPLLSIITAEDQNVEVGKTVSIGATTNSSAAISYQSNDTSVATVDADGVITGVAAGTTTITLSVAAVDGEFTAATKDITVTVSASYTPAVTIDGVFTDWNGVTEYPGTRTSGSSNSRINGWRMTQDIQNVYIYLDLAKAKFAGGGDYNKPNSYIYVCFDTEEGGSTVTSLPGVDQKVLVYPCVKDSNPPAFIEGADPRSQVNGSSDGTIMTWGVLGTGDNAAHAYVELCIPRSKLGLTTSGQVIQIGVSFQEYDAAKQSITLD